MRKIGPASRRSLAAVGILIAWTGTARATDHGVKADGTGAFTTIQACADVAKPGDECVVYAGTYNEHVKTAAGGTSETSRIIFKAEGAVTMQGFDIRHPFVTVDGFEITGYTSKYSGLITVMPAGSYCSILNNRIRDGADGVFGIFFYNARGQAAGSCVVRGNTLSNLRHVFLATNGEGHRFEENTFEYQNSRDYVYLFGANHVFRRNVFWRGTTAADSRVHPDFVQLFGGSGLRSENHLFEENWIENLQAQFSQMISGDGTVTKGIIYDNVKNITFRRNVIVNVSYNGNIVMPGVTFENNTFYRMAYALSDIGFGGSLTRGDASGAILKNNVFLAGGARASMPQGTSGYYSAAGAVLSKEVITVFVTRETDASGNLIITGPLTQGLFDDLKSNGYIDSNGKILDNARSLADVSELVLAPGDETYRQSLYDALTRTVRLDTSIRSSFHADYNFVAGAADAGFPDKRHSDCVYANSYTEFNFCELQGINGGDPRLLNLANPIGNDGIPFTLDDGLKPIPNSPLCGKGEGGSDIGAYSCDTKQVFSGLRAPTNLTITR